MNERNLKENWKTNKRDNFILLKIQDMYLCLIFNLYSIKLLRSNDFFPNCVDFF